MSRLLCIAPDGVSRKARPRLDAHSDDIGSAGESRSGSRGHCLQSGEGAGRTGTQREAHFFRGPASTAKVAQSFSYHRVREKDLRICEGGRIRIRRNPYPSAFRLLVRVAKAAARLAARSSVRDDHARPRGAPELPAGQGSKEGACRLFPVEESRVAAPVSYADLSLVLWDRR